MTTQQPRALLVRNGNALYLARQLDIPLPTAVYSALTQHMQYRHVTRLYGARRLRPEPRPADQVRVAHAHSASTNTVASASRPATTTW